MADGQSPDPKTMLDEIRLLMTCVKPGMAVGDLVLGELIGFGGTGVVFRAARADGRQPSAIKFLIQPPDRTQEEVAQLFNLQTAMLSEIEHPSIVPIRQFGTVSGFCYLAMDLFVGPEGSPVNVKDYAGWFGGRMAPGELHQLFRLLLGAFALVHEKNIVHGNLKPQNVLLTCTEQRGDTWEALLAVTDFGLTRIIGHDFVMLSVKNSLRHHGQGFGAGDEQAPPDALALTKTYDYFAPEQRRGEGASRRSDIFSLGLMFLELLTGDCTMGFEPPSSRVPGITPEWDAFIRRAVAPDRLKRYATVEEMLTVLNQLPLSG